MNPNSIPAHYVRLPDGSFNHPSRVPRSLGSGQPEPDTGPALVDQAQAPEAGRKRLGRSDARKSGRARRDPKGAAPVVRVHFHVRFPVRGTLDEHDNLRASLKPLVDAIAATLGVSDDDDRVAWEYSQGETRGEPGVTVLVET